MSSITVRKIGITELDTDAIVNAANSSLMGGDGVCGAIFNAAGWKDLQAACDRYGHCDTGKAVITPGFRTKAKYIIHAVGPMWQGGNHHEPQLLYSCYRESLRLAVENGCRSVAFPLISAGIYGYPQEGAWRKAVQACHDFLEQHPDVELDIVFAVLKDDILETGQRTLREIAPEHGQAEVPVPAGTDYLVYNGRKVRAVYFHLPSEPYGFLSNWDLSGFDLDGIHFNCNEQFIMYRKAMILGDTVTAQKILAADSPEVQQTLGRNAEGFNEVIWDGQRPAVAYRGLYEKFSQNADLKKKLLDTGNAFLVECAWKDLIWACGRRLDDEERRDIGRWRGRNMLGFTLMEVRDALRKENK